MSTLCLSEPPSGPLIRPLTDVTEVNDRETLNVECLVESVYPADGLEFELVSGGTVVSSRTLGDDPPATNSDDTFGARKIFSVTFVRAYSSTEDGLTCKVYHPKGDNQSGLLAVIVACE